MSTNQDSSTIMIVLGCLLLVVMGVCLVSAIVYWLWLGTAALVGLFVGAVVKAFLAGYHLILGLPLC